MSELYLYHATSIKNLESILQNGLLINPPEHNWEDMYCDGKIFLAFDADVAEDYISSCDSYDGEDIVVFKIALSSLHEDSIEYDWNNRCEYVRDINSCVYYLDIPANCLHKCNPSLEPYQTLDTFKGTNMYESIMCTFEEDVETNLEEYDY